MMQKKVVSKRKTKKQQSSKAPVAVRKLAAAAKPKMYGERHVASFPGFGFPDELRCCLKYVDEDVLFSGITAGTAQVYRGNSLFDPDLTGTGHQPQQFDQLSAVYGQYCVEGVAVKATVIGTSSAAAASCVLTVTDQNQSTQSVQTLHEGRWSKGGSLGSNVGMNRLQLALPPTSNAMIQGGKDIRDDPNNYTSVSSNPTDPTFVIFKARAIDGTTATDVFVTFVIEYQCVFRELIIDSPSLFERIKLNQLKYVEYLKNKEVPKKMLMAKAEAIELLEKQLGLLSFSK